MAVNIEKARHIGIMMDSNVPGMTEAVNRFADTLKGQKKKVDLLAYYKPSKKTNPPTIPYFTRKELNWYLKPSDKAVTDFSDLPFDLLINASINDCTPLEYVAAISRAKFRIGSYAPHKTHCYDFMIHLDKGDSITDYIDQLTHYLKNINKQ